MPDNELYTKEKLQKRRTFRSRWRKVVTVLASIVVFCTTYALILPALTLEKTCSLPEHTHGEDCYGIQIQRTLVCENSPHSHTTACYDETGQPVCGQADFFLHVHDSQCYGEDGGLLCSLPEIREHTHGEDCYECLAHTHDPECYTQVRGELICQQEEVAGHIHNEACTGTAQRLICTLEETEGHTHGEACFDEEGNLLCDREESEPHAHGEDCYETYEVECPLEEREGHTHSDECYQWWEELTCQEPEEEWVLTCQKREAAAHTHGDGCYDAEGDLICGKVQVLPHVHGETCYQEAEVQVLTCTLEEHTHDETCTPAEETEYFCGKEAHTHGEDCFDEEGTLTCPQEEHVHGGDCLENQPSPYLCGKEAHTHGEGCYDQEGNLSCTQEEHTHDADCLPKVYYCGREEHVHEETCLNEAGEQICGQEAHTHSDRCLLPILYCGQEAHTHEETCYQEDGSLSCTLEAHVHTAQCYQPILLTEAELVALMEELNQAVADLEAQAPLTGEDIDQAQVLLERLEEAYRQRWLTDDQFLELYGRVEALLTEAYDSIAEPCYGNNWLLLRDSGWFNAYSGAEVAMLTQDFAISPYAALEGDTSPSAVQIDESGGTKSADDVTVSKTIAGTELENVFDITLTVQTPQKIDEVISEPDMAVVIVMDISNTMNDNFGGVTRYAAAMEAAEDFLDNFAKNNSLGVSKVGYVAFNTDAHQIFGLQSCTNETQANALKNAMRTATGSIINANGYGVAHSRFTNIEGGLKMAQDMLNGATNKNKFIILLTDGFPTTYLESGYKGYDPYDTTGRFYDHVLNVPCSSGTSYSDEAAIRARNMAASIKSGRTTIFTIGVDVGGQTIQTYIDSSEKLAKGDAKISIVDRTGTTYEIGDASSTESYKNWLENSIGSGYYYDSTNTAGLKDAYEQIFETIKTTIKTATDADWVTSDVIPDNIDFIGLYDQNGDLQQALTDETGNSATYSENAIIWDLKQSQNTSNTGGDITWYYYEVKYRVRLENENSGFVENQTYVTNGTTQLQYRLVKTVDGTTTISDTKTIDFPVPSVHGYLGELMFTKQDNRGNTLAGAEFTLHHAGDCNICRGNGTQVPIVDQVEISDKTGMVKFTAIPSGHTYTLTETKIPDGYSTDGSQYTVTVAYDKVTVSVTDSGNNKKEWNGTIVNNTAYELPDTGGPGTTPYTLGGASLTLVAAALVYSQRKRKRGEGHSS